MRVDITLLGAFSVVVDGREVAAQDWTRRHAAALVKLLALRPGRRLRREQVVDLLWPDLLLDQAAPRLHKAAHYARSALGVPTGVVLSGDVVTLLPDAEVSTDVQRFEQAAAAHESGVGVRAGDEALAAYGGELLPEDRYEEWTVAERERLRVRHLALLRSTGRWRELLAVEPLDEEAHLRVAQRYVGDGDRAQALHHLDLMARLLRDELGTEPGPEVTALREQAEALPVLDPGRPAVPALRAAQVPRPATPTVGRGAEVAQVLRLLEVQRLVTLLGIGGVGKTRLGAELAYAWSRSTGQRVCYVDLTKVREPGLVAGLVVRELGIRAGDSQDAVQMLHEALRRQSMLLVLDNFEHVVAAADLAGEMVGWSPDLRLLVTSRARLRVAGEQVVEVHPLSVDAKRTGELPEAVALFEQVARLVDPQFRLRHHREDVDAICRSVDGLPLAIEIAGNHLRTLSPSLLRERLTGRLASRATAGRDLPDRQQTIPATIDWSLQLLSRAEQELFARFSVFHGPVSLEAVEALWDEGDVLDPLGVLVDQSLVRRTTGNRHEPRFGMLALVREHAATLLDDPDGRVAGTHAAYVAGLVEDLFESRWRGAAGTWLDDVTEALAEVRAAHDWARLHGDLPLRARLVAALGGYWFLEGHHDEGRRWVGEVLDREDELDTGVRGRLHLAAGLLGFPSSPTRARRDLECAAQLFRERGESMLLAYALAVCSATYMHDPEQYGVAMRTNGEALELARRIGSPALVVQVLNVRGEVTRVAGHDELARAAYEEALQLSREVGDDNYVSLLLCNLSYVAEHRGDHARARRLNLEGLRICWGLGRRLMAAWAISQLGGPEHGLGRPERGAVLIGAGDAALQALGARRHPGDLPEHQRAVEAIRVALGEARYAELREQGAAMSLDEALAYALEAV